LRKIRVPDSAPEQAPDPKQALDPELAPEGQRSSDHLSKIKVPDPAPELAPDTELVPVQEFAPNPDSTIIWLVIIQSVLGLVLRHNIHKMSL
jgi:hypothetical protein